MSPPINRRDFLRNAAGAAALGVAAASHAAEPKAGKSARLLKAVKFSMIAGNAPLAEKFTLLKRLGFDGVDMTQHIEPAEVKRAIKQSGLIVHGVVGYDHWKLPLSDPDASVRNAGRESFLASMRDAKAYGGTSTLLVPGKVTKQVPYADAYKRSQDEIRKMLKTAEELQMQILIENVWNDMLFSPLEVARYVDEIDSPWVGVYFDIGNCVKYGWPEHWIAALGKRIKKLDIKEYSRTLMNAKGPRAGFDVKIGDGDCDWPAIMRALEQIDYKGWATAEVPGGGEAELNDISVRMDRAFAKAE